MNFENIIWLISGICIEKIGPISSSKFRIAEQEDRILYCFEKAGDLAIAYLQEKEKSLTQSNAGVSPSPAPASSQDDDIGIILETAIQQSPLLYIKKGYVHTTHNITKSSPIHQGYVHTTHNTTKSYTSRKGMYSPEKEMKASPSACYWYM